MTICFLGVQSCLRTWGSQRQNKSAALGTAVPCPWWVWGTAGVARPQRAWSLHCMELLYIACWKTDTRQIERNCGRIHTTSFPSLARPSLDHSLTGNSTQLFVTLRSLRRLRVPKWPLSLSQHRTKADLWALVLGLDSLLLLWQSYKKQRRLRAMSLEEMQWGSRSALV